MRQILIGAWLVLACSAVVACNGAEFAPTRESSDDEAGSGSADASNKSGGAGRGSAGSRSTNGGSGSGGNVAAAGSSSVVPPAGGTAAGGDESSGGAGPGAENCAEGKVTFKMVPGPELAHDYVCDASCGTGWLTITDAEGASALSIFSACGTASCESCEALPCAAAACLPTPLAAKGTQLTWSGAHLEHDTCGANMACQRQSCVPAGRYKAKACANVNAGANATNGACMPKDGIMLCTEAEFDFPATSEVLLVLEAP